MVVSDASIHNIMGGMESTAGVRLHNHRRKLKQRFDIIKKLGQGTYGKVQLGINKETGQEVAIKTIKKAKIETEADLVRIRREIQIMSSVQHPNIIHIYEVFENREKMVLVMEYAAGGELYDFLSEKKVLAEEEARRIFRQIATAVYYCHKHKICHRDLKLENILLDEHGSAKIADFGLSNVFNEQRLLNTFCGSPLYASPEIVKGTPYHGPEVDCWSLGVLLYTLVYGAMPFDGSNFKRLVKQISQGDYFEPKKPSPASPLIREMLTVTPARRANIEKICAHWWVNEGHTESCLDIAEELANQTPVRLDLLLSLAPPPPAVGSDMLLTDEQGGGDSERVSSDALGPARCHSVGSIMELDQPAAERKLKEFERQKQRGSIGDGTPVIKDAPKRKLEEGASSEDVVHSGVKKKESCRRQDNEPSTSKSSPTKTSNKSSPSISTEEKMDVDMDIAETTEISGAVGNNREIAKNVTEVTEGASAITDVGTPQASATAEKESNKTTISRDKTTRKSLKGSAKKSKPASTTLTDNIAASNSVLSNKEMESKNKDEEGAAKVVENGTEVIAGLQAEVSSEINKEKEGVDATVTEAVKQKVKKKKKITSSKTDELITESSQNKADNVPCDASLELNDLKSKAGDGSSQDAKKELKNEEVTELETKEVSEINNVIPAAKDVTSNKTIDSSKIGSIRTKKPPGDLSLSKTGSSSEKSSGSEEVTSPTKTVERRRSKIFENSEQFNIFLRGSDSKSAVVDKPKKVFIPGVKVSDYKQAFERRSSLTSASSSSPIKNSASKKSIEQNSTNVAPNDISDELKNQDTLEPVLKSSDKSGISSKSKEQASSTLVDTAPSKQIMKDENSSVNSVDTNLSISKSEVNKEVVNDKTKPSESPKTSKDDESDLKLVPALQVTDKMSQQEKARIKKLKDAVEVISNAIAEETKRESGDSTPVRKISSTKPPVPGLTEKSKTKSASTKSPPTTPSEKKTVHTQLPADVKSNVPENVEKSVPGGRSAGEAVQKETDSVSAKQVEFDSDKNVPAKKKSSKVEITLKSATLPRRRTSKAEIQLGFPSSKPADAVAAGEYRTEVEHMVGNDLPSRLQTQRSEVAFPVAAAKNVHPISIRSSSLEPEGTPKVKSKPREHIIPIQVEQERDESIRPPAAKPPVPPLLQQRSVSQRSSSLSRQSTQDSDTDSTISVSGPEPIRKSPREYIIPIAVEGGGYVTPRAGSLEPSVSEASTETLRSSGRTNKLKKMGSLLSDSDDEGFNSPYVTLQRHSSVGREGDSLDDDRPFHRMHKLRSSKPRRATLEHNDSLSSAEEEDDDDDGFEILTAESLFSTLLSRVRSLTQRLNVEDGGRTGFPSSRLMSHLAPSGHSSPSSGFWSNIYGFPGDPLSRRVSESSQYGRPYGEGPTPWRRSVSRDNSEVDSVYSEGDGGTLPRASVRVTVHVPRGGLGRGRGWIGGAGTSTTANTTTTLLQPQQKATTTATY